MAYRPPTKFFQIRSAEMGKDADEATRREKLNTLERKVNEACHETVKDGFIPTPQPAIDANGNVVVFIGTDPRPLPGGESRISTPNAAPGLLLPPE